jgi:MFS transporter, PAT family, beta-lactamase induction signal transducer AmpG
MARTGNGSLILTQSKPLRLLTLFLFYFTQGFPIGLFFYAVPAWMAANGSSAAETASVVGMAALPWSLKLVNGFLIDRYTFLPMGRRRSWIIGAQGLIVLIFLGSAALAPAYSDVFLLSAIAFTANLAINFQDVGIDSLAVDIMAESERAKAGGIMFGAQVLGVAAATALAGALLQTYGFAIAMTVAAAVPAAVMIYGMFIREREGERRMPWSAGESHVHNIAVKPQAWGPLLRASFRAILAPLSLILLPILLLRALPAGAHEAFHPILAVSTGGWSLSDYTNVMSTVQLVSGLVALTIGGWAVDALGAQRSARMLVPMGIALFAAMALGSQFWSNNIVLIGYFLATDIVAILVTIALIPICMRMCSPAVAAAQFTIYMAMANFGRPLGAALAAATAGADNAILMYWGLVASWALVLAILVFVRFPNNDRAFHETAEVLPQGEGLAPVRD